MEKLSERFCLIDENDAPCDKSTSDKKNPAEIFSTGLKFSAQIFI